MNRLRGVIQFGLASISLGLIVLLGFKWWHGNRLIRAKQCVAQWVAGDDSQRLDAWRQLANDADLAHQAFLIAEARRTQVGDESTSRWLAALPTQGNDDKATEQAVALCLLLDEAPDLPTAMGTLVPPQTLAALERIARQDGRDPMRLRAFVWLLQCDQSSHGSWQAWSDTLCDMCASELIKDGSHDWLHTAMNQPVARELFTDWVERVSETAFANAKNWDLGLIPELKKYQGDANERYAFALKVPFSDVESLCRDLGKHGFRPHAIDTNRDGDSCNLIWQRDHHTAMLKTFLVSNESPIDEIKQELGKLAERGFAIWDLAIQQNQSGFAVHVITRAPADSGSWIYLIDEFDQLRQQLARLPYVYAEPRCLRVVDLGDFELGFVRIRLQVGRAWRVSYTGHYANLRNQIESESRQFFQLDFQDQPFPPLRYGPERRKAAELVLERDPEQELGVKILSRCQFHAGEFQACLDTLSGIEASSSDLTYLAIANAKLGDEQQAKQYLEELPEDDTTFLTEYIHASVEEASGRIDQAIALLDASLVDPEGQGSYNLACAYSLLLASTDLSQQQRQHVIDQTLKIIENVIEAGGESFSDMLEDNDLQPFLAIPHVKQRLGIEGDSYLVVRSVSVGSAGYRSNVVDCPVSDALFESVQAELKAGGIPVAFYDSGDSKSFSVWARPTGRGRDGLEQTRKQAAIIAALDPEGKSEWFADVWASHSSSHFRVLLTSFLSRQRERTQSTQGPATNLPVEPSDTGRAIREFSDEWQLVNLLEDRPEQFQAKLSELRESGSEQFSLSKRLDYLANVAANQDQASRLDEDWLEWVEVDLSEAFPEYDRYRLRILATEVPNQLFRVFLTDHPEWRLDSTIPAGSDCLPVTNVTWHQAAAFCNWLSARSSLGADEFVYQPIDASNPQLGLVRVTDHLNKQGFRLLAESEMGFLTRDEDELRSFAADVATQFMWVAENSGYRIRPVATRLPNGSGIYDLFGNVKEWSDQGTDPGVAVTLGGSVETSLDDYTVGRSNLLIPKNSKDPRVGFRVAQAVDCEPRP